MVYATEAHVEEIAAHLGLDPIELRRRNLLRNGCLGPTGQLIADPGAADCLELVAKRLQEWRCDPGHVDCGRLRGYGLACAWWLTMGAPSGATLVMNEDGSATVYTGATEIGTGAVVTGIAAIAADELGLPIDQIRVVSGSTDHGPYDVGSEGSRTLYGAGNAVRDAAQEARQIIAKHVAEHFEASINDIVFSSGLVSVVGSPNRSLSLAEAVGVAVAEGGPVVAKGRYQTAPVEHDEGCVDRMVFDALNEPTFHCHGVEIEVDDQTGHIFVSRYVAAHDVGTVLNPTGVRGQVEGGVVQGIGYALFEEIALDANGGVANPDLVDYRMPTIADVPGSIETLLVENHPAPTGPHGAKGVGEAPVILPAAAIGAALRDASGSQPAKLPLDPPRVLEFLTGREAQIAS